MCITRFFAFLSLGDGGYKLYGPPNAMVHTERDGFGSSCAEKSGISFFHMYGPQNVRSTKCYSTEKTRQNLFKSVYDHLEFYFILYS